MQIRTASVADVPVLVGLNRRVHAAHVSAQPAIFRPDPPDEIVAGAFGDALKLPSAFWLLAEDGAAVGFLSSEFRERPETWCVKASRTCYLAGIAVTPLHQGKGIARALLAELKHEAARRGVERIEVDVWTFNDTARRAYHHLGFAAVTERMILTVEAGKDSSL